ncbi:MAG: hypothetical protein IJS28_07165 [Synergistaceae bacterium]|nr:hypothetical protein [Synergistaceae bacterium]
MYKITLDSKSFIGTEADVARWYCKQKDIKLYIEPENGSGALVVYARMEETDGLTLVAHLDVFRGTDIETSYKMFFREYMQTKEEPDFVLTEAEQQDDSTCTSEVDALAERWRTLVEDVLQLYKDIYSVRWRTKRGTPERGTLAVLEGACYPLIGGIQRTF